MRSIAVLLAISLGVGIGFALPVPAAQPPEPGYTIYA